MSKAKVMIIDDSSTIRDVAIMWLKKEGYEVIAAEDGFEGFYKIVSEKPDIIFLDVLMPKLDGLQTCQILRKNQDFKNIPIIFLSSKDSEIDKAKGLIVGATDYLTKPFTKETIIEMINKYV